MGLCNRNLPFFFKLFSPIEKTRHQEVKDAPHFTEAVFNRGAGQCEAVSSFQCLDRLGGSSPRVFDILCFVQDHIEEGLVIQPGKIYF